MFVRSHTAHTHTTGADVNFRVPPSKGEEEDEGTRREELYWYQGMTPLMMALDLEDSPHLECIRTLLRLGADRSAQAGQDADPWGGGSIEGMTSFEILRKNIKSRVEEYVANEGIDIVDDWYQNEIQVYASHQVFRKFPHTAAAHFDSQLLSACIWQVHSTDV